MVMIRATSFLALMISLGVSRRSVADWNRRWNRFFTTSLRVRSSCSSLIPRRSEFFIAAILMFSEPPGWFRGGHTPPLAGGSNVRPARHEPAAERHLVRHAGQGVAGGRLGDAGQLEQDHARLDDGGPELRLALAL